MGEMAERRVIVKGQARGSEQVGQHATRLSCPPIALASNYRAGREYRLSQARITCQNQNRKRLPNKRDRFLQNSIPCGTESGRTNAGRHGAHVFQFITLCTSEPSKSKECANVLFMPHLKMFFRHSRAGCHPAPHRLYNFPGTDS